MSAASSRAARRSSRPKRWLAFSSGSDPPPVNDSSRQRRGLYPPIEPHARAPGRRRRPRDLLGGVRQPGGQAGGVPARRPGRRLRLRARAASSIRRATASCCSTSAAAAAAGRMRASRQHHLGPGRRHRAAARAPRHRALAGVRRLLGLHARARLRRDAPDARHASWCCAASSCCGESELDWFYQDGASALFPDALGGLPRADPASGARRPDARLPPAPDRHGPRRCDRRRARLGVWEGATSYPAARRRERPQVGEDEFALAFARIECHYFVNGGFLRSDEPAARRRRPHPPHPGVIVQGRYDVVCPMTHCLGPASRLARGGAARRPRRGALGLRARHDRRTGARDRSLSRG